MSDDNKAGTSQEATPANQATGYSAEYVKSLRDEAASWRTKLRDTETELTTLKETEQVAELDASIGTELKKRNIEANPAWVDIDEGQTIENAVDSFVTKYPKFGPTDEPIVQQRNTQKPMSTEKQNTNVQTGPVSDIAAIRKDPIARGKLRDQYRSLLNLNTGKHL